AYVQRNMLAYSTGHRRAWSERLPMRKSAAIAAVSTECGFPNGAAELWTRGRKSAAIAAVSTECGFPNGAAELWTRGRKSAAERILWNYQRDYRQSLLWYQMDTDWPTSEQIMLSFRSA